MRRSAVLALVASAAFVACGHPEPWGYGDNEIVFGIEQGRDGVAASYELIGLARHGGSSAVAFRDGDGRGRCWFERLDARLGQARLEDGVATWSGARLAGSGLHVFANQPTPTRREGVAWETGDTLFFTAEGFAMPPFGGVQMRAPITELTLGEIAPAPDASGSLDLTGASGLTVRWTPPADETRSRVMVALTTARAEVRCFDDAASGSAVVDREWIAKLIGTGSGAGDGAGTSDGGATDGPSGTSAGVGGVATTGTLTIATHRQSTTFGQGQWIVYAVASHVHRDIAFTMR